MWTIIKTIEICLIVILTIFHCNNNIILHSDNGIVTQGDSYSVSSFLNFLYDPTRLVEAHRAVQEDILGIARTIKKQWYDLRYTGYLPIT